MSYKDECGICGRVLRAYRLKKCERCKKLFCRDCMVEDIATGDPTHLLCLNCASRVVSPRQRSKYSGLTSHLQFRGAFTKIVRLSLARIDGLIGSNLPMSAYREKAWWSNASSSSHAKAWLDAGWEVQDVNLEKGFVFFKKVRDVPLKRKRRKSEIKKPFTPVRVRSTKPKVPSKTKVSKLYARIKNLERQRAERGYVRGFKPKSQYEKKLFKSKEKPQ